MKLLTSEYNKYWMEKKIKNRAWADFEITFYKGINKINCIRVEEPFAIYFIGLYEWTINPKYKFKEFIKTFMDWDKFCRDCLEAQKQPEEIIQYLEQGIKEKI